MSSIKSRIQVFTSKNEKPAITIEEHERLIAFMTTADFEYGIGKIIPTEDDGNYKITDIKFRCLTEEVHEHTNVGIDLSLQGEPQSYNSELLIFLEKE